MSESDADAPSPRFHTTRWSVVLAASERENPEAARAALSDLCAAYWYPLYAFLRRDGTDPSEALELVQGFIARLLEKGDVAADPTRGRFRSYLLGALRNFSANVRRAECGPAGSARAPFSLNEDEAESRYAREPADDTTPETLFERRWALTTLDQALARLESEYHERGRHQLFLGLKETLTGQSDVRYAELAMALGVSESAIKVAVHRMRARMREAIRDEVAQTVGDTADLDAEIRELLAALAR